jgi:hypothetical protein
MLKYKLEHFFSLQEKHNIELVKCQLETEGLNEREALENGWLLSADKWYQCRSVRIVLRKFNVQPTSFNVQFTKERASYIIDIYNKYVEYKGFRSIDSDVYYEDERTEYLILKDEGHPVAFTKFQHYTGLDSSKTEGLESQLNAWNFHKPKLALGKKMIAHEAQYAITLGLDHLYIGEGCELGSMYKADLPGFEWWTGSEWSDDKETYKNLCIRESNIRTIYELADIFNA